MSSTSTASNKNELFGHPKGLSYLFLTEMWERFSYYGMRVLLVLYMVKYLFERIESGAQTVYGYETIKSVLEYLYEPLTHQALSSHIYGFYTGLVYLTPLLGGYVADRYWGRSKSVYVGGGLMAIGHLLMAVESLFFPALLFLIFGSGFFKPNISTQVGGLYKPNDQRKDSAYTIFYMGINLGATFSPLVCGTLGQKVGWHYGFAAAGVGMLIGLFIYWLGQKHLPHEEFIPVSKRSEAQNAIDNKPLSSEDKKNILGLFILCFLNILFWGVYEQQGNVLQLWADAKINWNIWGFDVPSTWYQSFNPIFIFLLSPLMMKVWSWQRAKSSEPNSTTKMAIGCFLMAFGFLVLVWGSNALSQVAKLNVSWLFWCTFLFTWGELYLSPIGLSLVSKIAPARMVSLLMGVWLSSSAFGNIVSGNIGAQYEKLGDQNFFFLLVAMSSVAGFLFIIVNRVLKLKV